jgi:starch synthase
VRRTGGLADTVLDVDEHPGRGTGFVFDEPTAEALLVACVRAMAVFRDPERSAWNGIVARGMELDFDWARSSAPRYAEAYRRAVSLRREALSSGALPRAGLALDGA